MNQYLELVQDSVDAARWHSIISNPSVREAHDALVQLAQDEPERNHFGATTKLLNHLSLAVFDVSRDARSADDRDHAFVFCANHDIEPHGDIADTKIKPNYPSYIGTRANLELALSYENYVRDLSWGEVGSVAEQSWKRGGSPMLSSSLFALKRYRPDLPTVHGFSIHRGRIQLSQVSASGIWSSRNMETKFIEPWIAFVVLVYQAYDARDRKLAYRVDQIEFTRWDFHDTGAHADAASDETEPITLAPFYLRKPFGVTTFAAFQVSNHPDSNTAFFDEEVRGVWKSSWHASDGPKERALLDRLHKDGWIPGLVRPYPAGKGEGLVVPTPVDIAQRAAASVKVDEEHAAQVDALLPLTGRFERAEEPVRATKPDAVESFTSGARSISSSVGQAFPRTFSGGTNNFDTLEQEIIHLASVGEPLSQCASPRELLQVAYDLLETHLHVCEEGLIHRDLSWFNVLCKGEQFYTGDKNEKPRPCIKGILHDLAAGDAVDNATFKSSVLLIDFDNAISREELAAETQKGNRPLVGTPGFIAFELQCPEGINEPEDWTGRMWDDLFDALNVEELAHGVAAISRAFPRGDGEFMAKLRKVHQLELARDCADWKPHTQRPAHNMRHDAESVFWIFFIAFLRAQPRDTKKEDRNVIRYATAYRAVLAQAPGPRERFLFQSHNTSKVFHSAFAAFEGLFQAIGFYFNIPWHLYETVVSPEHAHIALRRMILRWLLKVDAQVLDITLNTERPRPLRAVSEPTRRSEGGSGDITRVPSPREPAQYDEQSKKRKTCEPCDSGFTSAKRAATGHDALPSALGEDQDVVGASWMPRVRQEGPLARAAKDYRHDLHAHLRSAHVLRLKVWKDREYWFGTDN
ncbi:hypothetical protein AURDEDRAFT_158120 [Auricularia subglabra TFB-10046 SS5]|nr:hypothetical protein AURDEDRAFT_158120 [Auricularia subglabra TFB-10046 SS5]